jgi:hypothetical protein
MNIEMIELHGIGIRDITSLSNNKVHKECIWVCLDIVDEIHAHSPWHMICSGLVPKCIRSHHTHANEQNIGVDN